jgi:hypothetical protein
MVEKLSFVVSATILHEFFYSWTNNVVDVVVLTRPNVTAVPLYLPYKIALPSRHLADLHQ